MEEIINNISKLTLEKNINTKRPKKLIIKIKKVYLKNYQNNTNNDLK